MKKTIINFRWLLFVLLFSALIVFGVLTLCDDLWLSSCVIIIGSLLVLGYTFLIPNRYTFSADGITVYYGFGLKTFLRWKEITHFEDHWDGGKLFPWWRSYEIGYFDSKIVFHQEATIPKTKRITAQITKYYHKTIEKRG